MYLWKTLYTHRRTAQLYATACRGYEHYFVYGTKNRKSDFTEYHISQNFLSPSSGTSRTDLVLVSRTPLLLDFDIR